MNKNCENCRFWLNHNSAAPGQWGDCLRAEQDNRMMRIYYEGDEDDASLETHRDFGCTLWEDK